uniref:Protein fem-1 homolog CG6966-like n=1 Tax=Phallusia mammillata TaxID=59560 RepID=A0A6F9DC64_9ASCI|nr:protein fem-1 homolog CG6966-like [Phallusia mammillata]
MNFKMICGHEKDVGKLQLTIFNAAKEGKLKQIKSVLASLPISKVKAVTSAKVEGSTALISAAREGHVDIVQYLITKCHTDLQQCGSVVFDGETIEDAPPLWCAAAAGHFAVVKCLVQHKANPNCTTQTNSTPMRAACFDGHLGIVKYLLDHKADIEIANRHQHTCLMIACYKGHKEIVQTLLEAGAGVNRCSIKRNTALHDCAENGSVSIAKLLLKHNAKMQKDSHGMTPLMTAAVAGHVQLADFFSGLPDTPAVEKINSNELLGATYLDKKHDLSMAFNFWKKALTLRALSNTPLRTDEFETIAAYGNVREPTTVEELEQCRADPERSRMISLLIRERVLGPKHPDTSYYIRYRGAVFADSGNFEKCIGLWMYALDMQRNNLEPLYPMTLSSLLSFAELFSFMQQARTHDNTSVPKAKHKQILEVLKRAVSEILLGHRAMLEAANTEKDNDTTSPKKSPRRSPTNSETRLLSAATSTSSAPPNGSVPSRQQSHRPNPAVCCSMCEASNQRIYRAMVITLHLTALSEIVLNKQSDLSEEQVKREKQERGALLYQLREVKDHCDRTLLHLASCSRACSLGRYPVTRFPNHDIVDVLLRCGFDPNSQDKDGKTPTHLAAETALSLKISPSAITVIAHLIKGGAHMDYADKKGQNVPGILGPELVRKINPVGHQNLQCLCAQVIKKHNLDYQQRVPPLLAECISKH